MLRAGTVAALSTPEMGAWDERLRLVQLTRKMNGRCSAFDFDSMRCPRYNAEVVWFAENQYK